MILEKNPEVAKKQRVDLEDFFDGKVCFNVVEEITGYEDRAAFVYANWDKKVIESNDKIELLQFVGGG